MAKVRSWFLDSKTDFGYSYINSLYIFASSGDYGNTLSMTIRASDNRMIGIFGIDFKPLVSGSTFITSNLVAVSQQSLSEYSYFLLNPSYLNSSYSKTDPLTYGLATWNFTMIASQLKSLIYKTDDATSIKNSMVKSSFQNIKSETIWYLTFTAEGSKKLMFFSPWYLKMRARDDRNHTITGDVFLLISSEKVLTDQRNEISSTLYTYAAVVLVLFGLFIITVGFMFSNWLTNRYSGSLMK